MKCWVILYFHRYGTDGWPWFSQRKPTEKQVISTLMDWEGDEREDEWVEIVGPWEVPKPQPSPDAGKHAEVMSHLIKEAGPG